MMTRPIISKCCVLTALSCLCFGCGAVILPEDNAKFIMQSQLRSTDGFVAAEISDLRPGWGKAQVSATLEFRIEGLPEERVPTSIRFARIDGQWRVLDVDSRGITYPSLTELGARTMDDLYAKRRAAMADAAIHRGREMTQQAMDSAQELGEALKDGVNDWLH